MQNTGLITGASSGIGRALAHEHAKRGRDVVIVARREKELNELAEELRSQYGVQVRVIVKDLTAREANQEIYDEIEAAGIDIDYLFNNAGYGGHGKFHERQLSKDLNMIDLNIKALVELTHLFLNDMVSRGKGKILQVSSTAGFMPGPLQATYFATKAFVNSFSQALDEEVREHGVTVTALCPGAVSTEFSEQANLEGTGVMQNAKTPEYTAKKGYDAMEAGKLKVITEPQLAFMINVGLSVMPMRSQLKMMRKMQEK